MGKHWPARIAGAAAGLANGLFGGGGGMVFLPILSRWGSLSQRKLYATCVGVIFPVCLVSGGNVDVTTLSRIITKGLIKSGRITEITTKVEDKPGTLLQLLKVVADSGANILSINHAREDQHSDVGACMVSMVLETRDAAHVEQIRRELTAMGYELAKE